MKRKEISDNNNNASTINRTAFVNNDTFSTSMLNNTTMTSAASTITTSYTPHNLPKALFSREIIKFFCHHELGDFKDVYEAYGLPNPNNNNNNNNASISTSPNLDSSLVNLNISNINNASMISLGGGMGGGCMISTTSASSTTSTASSTSSETRRCIQIFDSLNLTIAVKFWLLRLSDALHKNLVGIVEPFGDIYRIINNLVNFTADNKLFLNIADNTNKDGNGGSTDGGNGIHQNKRFKQTIERLPTESRVLSVSDLLGRDRNQTSKSSLKDKNNQILRMLVGKIGSIQSNNTNTGHVLTLSDATGEIVIEITSSNFYLLDTIVFIPFFNVICTSSSTNQSSIFSLTMTTTSRQSTMSIGGSPPVIDISKINYIEVETIYIIHRFEKHYYEQMISLFKKTQLISQQLQQTLSATRNEPLEQFIIHQCKPYTPIQKLNQSIGSNNDNNNSINTSNMNIYGTILSKSAILHTSRPSMKESQVDTLFFIKIKDNYNTVSSSSSESNEIFLVFFQENLKWYNLLSVGNTYIFTNVTTQLYPANSELPQRYMIVVRPTTNIFNLAVDQSYKLINNLTYGNSLTDITSPSINIIEQLNYDDGVKYENNINCIITITEEANNILGTIGIDGGKGKLFISHYRFHLFHGRGFRVGTVLKLFNVHPIYFGGKLFGVGMCPSSSFKFLQFDCKSLLEHIPFSKSTISQPMNGGHNNNEIWKKYSIVDSYCLGRLLQVLEKRFGIGFNPFQVYKNYLQGKPVYENIGKIFGFQQMKGSGFNGYDTILSDHSNHCSFNDGDGGKSLFVPNILKLDKLSQLSSDKYSIKFINPKQYSLLGKLELTPQGFEWGKVSLSDSNGSVDCFITDINEYHLNKVWKINSWQLNFEEFIGNGGGLIKTINYLQFSMKDCELVSPLINNNNNQNQNHLVSNNHLNIPFQKLFNQYQICDLNKLFSGSGIGVGDSNLSTTIKSNSTFNIFILLLGKSVELGLINLNVCLLIPSLPNITIKTTLSLRINFPILQVGHCYYLSDVSLSSSDSSGGNGEVELILTSGSILKSIALVHKSNQGKLSMIYPSTLKGTHSSNLGIPFITIDDVSFFKSISKVDTTSGGRGSSGSIQSKSIKEIYNGIGIDQADFISFRGLIVSKRIEYISTSKVISGGSGGSPTNSTSSSVSSSSLTSNEQIIIHLIVTDPNNPGQFLIPISIENFYCGLTVGSVIDFFFLQTKPTWLSSDIGNSGKSKIICHSNRFFYFKIDSNHDDHHTTNKSTIGPNETFDYIDGNSKLSSINSNSLDQYYRVIGDIVTILKFKLSFKCKKCNMDHKVACKCDHDGANDHLSDNTDEKICNKYQFTGLLECEVSDGSSLKKLLITKESLIASVLNLSLVTMNNIKLFSIKSNLTFSWNKFGCKKNKNDRYSKKLIFNNNKNDDDESDRDSNYIIELNDNFDQSSSPLSNSSFTKQFPILLDIFKQLPQKLSIILKKQDIQGNSLLCCSIDHIDDSKESWKLLNSLK